MAGVHLLELFNDWAHRVVSPVPAPVIITRTTISDDPDAFDEYLSSSNKRTITRLAFSQGGVQLPAITVLAEDALLSGSIDADATRFVQRTGTLNFAPRLQALIPANLGDPLAPPTTVKVSSGFRYPDGSEHVESLGVFDIDTPSLNDDQHSVGLSLKLTDLSARIADRRYRTPWPIVDGTTYRQAMIDFILGRDPRAVIGSIAAFDTHTTVGILFGAQPAQSAPDRDLTSLASQIGHVVFVDVGGDWTAVPPPDPATAIPVARYVEGERRCTMVTVGRSFSRRPGYNGVVGRAEGPNLVAPLGAESFDLDPASPTNALGDWGYVPYFWTTQLISDNGGTDVVGAQAQLQQAVDSLRLTIKGTDELIKMTALNDPRRKPNQVAELKRDRIRLYGRGVFQKISWPLDGSLMTVQFKARRI